jgi:hypothetical protein
MLETSDVSTKAASHWGRWVAAPWTPVRRILKVSSRQPENDGQQACRHGYRVIYRRLPRLFPEVALTHGDGPYSTLLARFARVDVRILDDWGLAGLKDAERQDLLEILDDRDGSRSTMITSQLPSARPANRAAMQRCTSHP